jgi:hypothetical protein
MVLSPAFCAAYIPTVRGLLAYVPTLARAFPLVNVLKWGKVAFYVCGLAKVSRFTG